ncbi:MAG: tetratricopeptide repeat protein [Rhodothermales bacterium]|nr:tetratricopeptide repeat protein [Rhodothermales bacterium]
MTGSLLPAKAFAQDLAESVRLFDEGTAHVEAGRYAQAVTAFDAALQAGHENPALHYNQGVAHFRLDQIAEARAAFERARRLAPEDRTILHNISIVEARTRDQFSQLPDTFSDAIWRVLDRRLGAGLLFGLGLAGYLAWCVLMAMRSSRLTADWRRRGLWFAGVAGMLGIALGLGTSMRPADGPSAVVAAEEIALLPEPSESAEPELEIHEGLLVEIEGSSDTWTAVRLPNGVSGWVRSEHLIRV